jgi:hypothetical protein
MCGVVSLTGVVPMYVGTMVESSKLKAALSAYNKVARTKLPDVTSFQKMLSVSPKLRAWYEDWSFSNSAFKSMPKSFSDSGVTREEWAQVQAILPKINQLKAESSLRVEKRAAEFSNFVEQENTRLNEELAKIQPPLVEILKVNVLCLDFEKQFEIMSLPPEKQEPARNEALELLRKKLLEDLRNGTYRSPFEVGDFSELVNFPNKNDP